MEKKYNKNICFTPLACFIRTSQKGNFQIKPLMMRIPFGGYCFEYVMCDLSSASTNNLKAWVLSKGTKVKRRMIIIREEDWEQMEWEFQGRVKIQKLMETHDLLVSFHANPPLRSRYPIIYNISLWSWWNIMSPHFFPPQKKNTTKTKKYKILYEVPLCYKFKVHKNLPKKLPIFIVNIL